MVIVAIRELIDRHIPMAVLRHFYAEIVVRLSIDFLEATDSNSAYLVTALQYGLNAAVDGELVSPDFETEIRAWMKAETVRLRPLYQVNPQVEYLRESKWFEFWSKLRPEQEVRWTKVKIATYFVVSGKLETEAPHRGRMYTGGPFVELRRHTGKTFWAHIAQVRPAGYIKNG